MEDFFKLCGLLTISELQKTQSMSKTKDSNEFLYLEEVGVDKREREELGVSDLGSAVELFPREFCTGLFPLEFAEVTDIGVSSSKSMRRCVFERRLELARPVMISFDEFFCVS